MLVGPGEREAERRGTQAGRAHHLLAGLSAVQHARAGRLPSEAGEPSLGALGREVRVGGAQVEEERGARAGMAARDGAPVARGAVIMK
jgi:hypothetical protein